MVQGLDLGGCTFQLLSKVLALLLEGTVFHLADGGTQLQLLHLFFGAGLVLVDALLRGVDVGNGLLQAGHVGDDSVQPRRWT